MMAIRTSQPPTPSTSGFGAIRPPNSTASSPIVRLMRPSPSGSPDDHFRAQTHPLPTPIDTPRAICPGPAAMGRSVSEPQSLSDLGGFGPHQVPRDGVISVARGRRGGGGRPRAATVSLQPPNNLGDTRRGRSPGPRPSLLALRSSNSSSVGLGTANQVAQTSSEPDVERAEEGEAEVTQDGGEAVRRDLGIRDLFRSRRGRGRGRPSRGRATTH